MERIIYDGSQGELPVRDVDKTREVVGYNLKKEGWLVIKPNTEISYLYDLDQQIAALEVPGLELVGLVRDDAATPFAWRLAYNKPQTLTEALRGQGEWTY